MAISGFLLWFNNFALRHFPKWIRCSHRRALVRSLARNLFHFALVIFDPLVYPMDTAWLDGKIPADHYRHSRPGYLRARARAGLVGSVKNEASPQVKSDSAIKPETSEKSGSPLPEKHS